MRRSLRNTTFTIVFLSFLFLFISDDFASPEKSHNPVNTKDQEVILKIRQVDRLNALSDSLKDLSGQESFFYANKALGLAKEINYKEGLCQSSYLISDLYNNQGDYLNAFKFSIQSCDYAKEMKDHHFLARAFNQIGYNYLSIKKNYRAYLYFLHAISEAVKAGDSDLIILDYHDISMIYSDSDKSEIVRRNLFYSLYLSLKSKNKLWETMTLKQLGIYYLQKNDFDKALYYFNDAVRMCFQAKNIIQISPIYTMIAYTYEQKKDFRTALKFNQNALDIRKRINPNELIASSFINIGHTYLQLNDLDSALYYLDAGIALAARFNFKKNKLLEHGYQDLYFLYLKKGDLRNACEQYTRYSSYKDSVNDEKNKRAISVIGINYIITDNEKEAIRLRDQNFIQRLEIRNRNLLLLLLLFLLLTLSFLAVVIYRFMIRIRNEKRGALDKNYQLQDEIREHVIRNEELAKREQEIRFIADHTADLILLINADFIILYASSSCESFLGYSPEEMMGKKDIRDLLHPDSRKLFDSNFERIMQYQEATMILNQIVRKNGSVFWAESNVNPVFDGNTGKVQAFLTNMRDVTDKIDQERALVEESRLKEMMIRDVHNRVKNNLAILASVVNMQSSRVSDDKMLDIFSDLQFRVRAMSLVHEELYMNRNIEVIPIGEYLSNLTKTVSSGFSTDNINIHTDFYNETLNVKISLPLGLIVNELLTNAFKYAFPDSQEGNIWVSYVKINEKEKTGSEIRCLTVRDDGIGLPSDFDISKKTSMGSQIIMLLARQLEGELKIEGTKGASFSLILPLQN
jgi:PAS domain S-box-containing protein